MKFLVPLLLALSLSAHAARTDLPGSADPPAIKRFEGSWITGYAKIDWAQTQWPAGPQVDEKSGRLAATQTLEGRSLRVHYLVEGKTALEVFRNYQQAMSGAGLQTRLLCERGCEALFRAWWRFDPKPYREGMRWDSGAIPGTGMSHEDAPTGKGFMLIGSLGGSSPMQLLLHVSPASNTEQRFTSVFLHLVEPKAMPTGQVTVDAQAIGQGLQSEGKTVLYGLLFDTGKTDIKAESHAQLEAMAAALKERAQLKVYIVGHTDNVGSLDANLQLSQGRAQAVVDALTQRGIAANRLLARGVASLAPVALNTSEDGRSRNRRVEMVIQ